MRFEKLVPLALASFALACSEAPERSVTDPDLSARFAKPISSESCNAVLSRSIKTHMADLFAKPELDGAKALWATVEAQCSSNLAQAKESMLAYVQFTIDNTGGIIQPSGTWQGNLISHWASTFTYVGYTGANNPGDVPTDIFETEGAVGVIPALATGQEMELPAANAALTMYAQNAGTGDPRGHLFVIYPLPASCLGVSNLAKAGPCYEFGSFPQVAPAFDPMIKVGICQKDNGPHLNTPALAHLTQSVARVQHLAESVYPTFCSDVASTPAGSWNGGIRGIASRLAWHAQQAILPKPLYAVHGGLGGLGGKLSPHQAVDLLVFDADFETDAVGQFPGIPKAGTFSAASYAQPPGSILVQSSLGQDRTQLVVLSQGGGNCGTKCGGLLLEGELNTGSPGAYATNGVYEAEWVSLQDAPTLKKASFFLRTSSGADLASVHYSTKSNANNITFGTSNDVLAKWVRYVPMHFLIRVDLDANTATLFIDHGETAAASITFPATANFAKIVADFSGIDSGIMGWDDIKVQRVPGT